VKVSDRRATVVLAVSCGAFQFWGRLAHDVGAKHSDSAFTLRKVLLPNASPLLSSKDWTFVQVANWTND